MAHHQRHVQQQQQASNSNVLGPRAARCDTVQRQVDCGRSAGLPCRPSITQYSTVQPVAGRLHGRPACRRQLLVRVCVCSAASQSCAHTRHASITVGLLTLQRAVVRLNPSVPRTQPLGSAANAGFSSTPDAAPFDVIDLCATVASC